MTICDLTNAYASKSGGVRTYLHEKRRFLLAHTPHRHVMIVPGARDEVETGERASTYFVRGLPIPGCAPYRAIHRLDKVLRILQRERPDIVELGPGYALPSAAFAYRRRTQAAVVGFCHTDYVNAYVRPFLRRWAPPFTPLGTSLAWRHLWWVYRNCDAVFAASDVMVEMLAQVGVTAVKTPLGVDVEVFHPSRRDERLRQDLGVSPHGILAVYAGRLDREKRIDVLLEAFRLARRDLDASLLIVGDGPYRSHVDKAASSRNGIIRLPYQPDRLQLARVLASADVYVTASPYETFGLSVAEAQASGLPVVGVKAGALIERVPDTMGLLGEAGSAQAMADNLIALCRNGIRDKGKAAREAVETSLTWEVALRRLVQAYEAIARTSTPG